MNPLLNMLFVNDLFLATATRLHEKSNTTTMMMMRSTTTDVFFVFLSPLQLLYLALRTQMHPLQPHSLSQQSDESTGIIQFKPYTRRFFYKNNRAFEPRDYSDFYYRYTHRKSIPHHWKYTTSCCTCPDINVHVFSALFVPELMDPAHVHLKKGVLLFDQAERIAKKKPHPARKNTPEYSFYREKCVYTRLYMRSSLQAPRAEGTEVSGDITVEKSEEQYTLSVRHRRVINIKADKRVTPIPSITSFIHCHFSRLFNKYRLIFPANTFMQ